MNYLYHYTSVESLALILKNRSFRFSPLSVLDDLQEERVKDQQKFGKYVFVSSWTEEEEESIPMWNMYSNMSSGIRIKMKKNPFKIYGVDTTLLSQKFHNMQFSKNIFGGYDMNFLAKNPVGVRTEFSIKDLIIPSKDYFTEEYYLYNIDPNDILIKVSYTKDDVLLTPQIADDSSIRIGKLGINKKRCLEFQKEWRYILRFAPVGFKEMVNYPIDSMQNTYNRYGSHINMLPFKFYYLKLKEDAFETMEITLSPKISDGYRAIAQVLKQVHNPSMIVKDSSLSNDIR